MRRGGFSLVEVIVAAVLLSVAILSIAAGGALALRTLARAETELGALVAATALLDSLAQRPAAGAGTIRRGPYPIAWSAADTAGVVRVAVAVRDPADSSVILLGLAVLAAPAPLRLDLP